METIDSTKLHGYEVSHYQNPELKLSVQPIDESLSLSDANITEIANICSQPLVYEMLFKARFQDRPYTREDAEWFINWAKEGWDTGKYFVFLGKDQDDHIVSAIDIKSDTPLEAEIGYWADENHPGYMTNMLEGLKSVAWEAGYKSLMGYVRPDNDKSQRVLLRAGFKEVGEEELEEGPRLKFTCNLETNHNYD